MKKIFRTFRQRSFMLLSLVLFSAQAVAQTGEHTSFLLDHTNPANKGIQRAMNYLAFNDAADREAIRDAIKRNGGNVAYIFLSNQGDVGPRSLANINPYTSWPLFGHPSALDNNKVDNIWKPRIQELINDGIEPIFWLLADDSPQTSEPGTPSDASQDNTVQLWQLRNHVAAMVNKFDSMAKSYVIGLEADEYLTFGSLRNLAALLDGLTNKSVGLHLTSVDPSKPADLARVQTWVTNVSNIDTYYHQYPFLTLPIPSSGTILTPSEVKQQTEIIKPLIGNKTFIASEYCLKSDTLACQALGDAAIAGGALHTGNGRTPPPSLGETRFIPYKRYLIPLSPQ